MGKHLTNPSEMMERGHSSPEDEEADVDPHANELDPADAEAEEALKHLNNPKELMAREKMAEHYMEKEIAEGKGITVKGSPGSSGEIEAFDDGKEIYEGGERINRNGEER